MTDDYSSSYAPENEREERPNTPRPPVIRIMNRDEDEDGAPDAKTIEMLAMVEESMKSLEEGEIVLGTVLRVNEKEVVVDIGGKSEGVIAIDEFADADAIRVGDRIDVFLENMENQDGLVELSKTHAPISSRSGTRSRKPTTSIRSSRASPPQDQGRSGGRPVRSRGVPARIADRAAPGAERRGTPRSEVCEFKIIKLNKRRRNIVVSRRVVLEEERAQPRRRSCPSWPRIRCAKGWSRTSPTSAPSWTWAASTDCSTSPTCRWGRISHPSEVVSIGDRVMVKVLSFDPERERISLGLKQLTPYPWENVDDKFPIILARARQGRLHHRLRRVRRAGEGCGGAHPHRRDVLDPPRPASLQDREHRRHHRVHDPQGGQGEREDLAVHQADRDRSLGRPST